MPDGTSIERKASMKGRRSTRSYAVRAGSEHWAFVPHPEVSGWWLRVHPCVLVSPCPVCASDRGQPCTHTTATGSYVSWTHAQRRRAAAEGVNKLNYSLGIMLNLERPRRTLPSG